MIYARTLKFAAIQAKLRARIGKLPDAETWRAMALAPASELTDDLDGIGLDFWLQGLPANVSRDGLERHFMGRVRILLQRVAAWLPGDWEDFRRHLVLAPDIFWLAPILAGEDPGTRLDPDSRLQHVARSAPQQRRGLLEETPFAGYVAAAEPPELQWRDDLASSIPRLPRAERRPIERLRQTLERYLAEKSAEFERLAEWPGGSVEAGAGGPGAWRHHRALEEKLYTLLAGDPFHPALILIYALFELLTMEKLRALLLCRLLGWTPPTALTGSS